MRSIIGFSMRVYRASPFYPRLGRSLARVMALATRFRSSKPIIHEVDGIQYELDLREVIDSSLYYSGTFEAQAERAIAAALKPGMIAIDVGANIGYHTFRMARAVGPAGRVVAIEPTAAAFAKLNCNGGLNDFKNIEYVKCGISDKDLGATEIAFQSSYRLDGTCVDTVETVRLVTLDTLFSELKLPRVDFIKLDIDGFEGKAFRGAAKTLAAHHPTLLFEISPSAMKKNGDDSAELIRMLRELKYTFKSEKGEPIGDIDAFCAGIANDCSANLVASAGEKSAS